MQFAKSICAVSYPDEDGRSRGDKGLHVSHGHLEWGGCVTCQPKLMDSILFGATKHSGRKDGNVGVSVSVCGMQITPHFFNKNTDRTAYIRHGRIQEANHE